MKRYIKHQSTLRTLAVVFAVIIIALVGLALTVAFFSHPAIGLACLAAIPMLGIVMPEEQFQTKVLNGVEALHGKSKTHDADILSLKQCANELTAKIDSVRKSIIFRGSGEQRPKGRLSDEAARGLTADVILHTERSGKLEALIPEEQLRESLRDEARSIIGLSSSRALTTTEIPLPTAYGSEFRELIAEHGVARKNMVRYPLGAAINRPPRHGTRPAFGYIEMSAAFAEKKPTIDFCSMTPKKVGGIVIFPRELRDQSSVDLGQFLARYGAVEFARAEDTWAFLADGTATYGGTKGVAKICADNGKTITLAAGKTKPSDAALDDFRAMRQKCSTAALAGGKYFLNQSWESRMRGFNSAGDPNAFIYRPDGTAVLDGFPIVWTEVLQPYGTVAAASQTLAAFGRLDFWYFGEHQFPRIDTSEHVYFLYDQLATRFIEEIDFDYLSLEAMSTLATPAA